MNVKPVNEISVSMDSVELVGRNIVEKKCGFIPVRKVRAEMVEVEVDRESGGSSTEEADSPKSVANFGRKEVGGFVHSQVLRVKEEELQFREDVDADKKKSDCHQERHVNVVVFARSILPCSLLSGKTSHTKTLKATSH